LIRFAAKAIRFGAVAGTRESPLRPGDMRARKLNSTMIDRVVFDDEAETLKVSFRGSGRSYTYMGVPRAIYDALVRAQSAGRYFNDCIRGHFACHSDRRRYPVEG
jgi:hypothetical protein